MSIETEVENRPAVLPLLKERAVYVRNNGAGVDDSNFINKSFKGILRLSPNDSSSYLEMDNYVAYNDVTEDYISFEDTITNQLTKQFIKVSTSDGYMLDLRISKDAVEYDNLYVLGAVKVNSGVTHGSLQLYANSNKAFRFGKSNIISNYNKEDRISQTSKDINRFEPIDDKNINEAYILLTKENGDMEFANINNIVEIFVKAALMKLSAVPSGSIHAIPVDLYQYNKLMEKARANKMGHNIALDGNDPIIRDYLICDGSYYKAKDFPELAKVLYKEKICYHKNKVKYNGTSNSQEIQYSEYVCDEIKDDNENIIPNENIFEKTIVCDPLAPEDDENRYETVKVFRVPDLRGMFLQSVIPGLADAHNNPTGEYERDSLKSNELMIEKSMDHHYHYIVLDSPNSKRNSKGGAQTEITTNAPNGGYATFIDASKPTKNQRPSALTRYGAIAKIKDSTRYKNGDSYACTKPCRWDHITSGYGLSPIYEPNTKDWRGACVVVGPSGGYILSTVTPKESEYLDKPADPKNPNRLSTKSWVGITSWPIDMSIPGKEYPAVIDQYLNYTKDKDDPIYKGNSIDYVSYNLSSGNTVNTSLQGLLGYENTPEYYAILPLIKI